MDASLGQIMNSPGLWIASSLMVITVLTQAIVFLRTALKEAHKIGLERERYIAGMRSAVITSIGPSLSPIIVLLSLIAIIGGPTTWMRLCDIGAARTELSMVALSSGILGIEPGTAAFNIDAFIYSIWGMALNNLGWLLISLISIHKMTGIVDKLYTKYNPKWIKLLMAGTMLGLFAYLVSSAVVSKAMTGDYAAIVASLIAAATMVIINRLFSKNQRLQEIALGLAMLVGMFATQVLFG